MGFPHKPSFRLLLRQYDMAIVRQNVGYNQPPHLSYDPATEEKGDDGSTTAIRRVVSSQSASPIYNLQGQRMPQGQLPKGIYIQHNHKISIR